jgi:phosphoserine phosphatase
VLRRLKAELAPSRIVMVGDGVSDLETLPEVDLFVGYGGVITREKVRAGAPHFITRMEALPSILGNLIA